MTQKMTQLHTIFNLFINNHVDDTGDNTLGTISFLGLQSIVQGVDRLDGHCLHNHDRKSHLKILQGTSTGFGFQVQQRVIATGLA